MIHTGVDERHESEQRSLVSQALPVLTWVSLDHPGRGVSQARKGLYPCVLESPVYTNIYCVLESSVEQVLHTYVWAHKHEMIGNMVNV